MNWKSVGASTLGSMVVTTPDLSDVFDTQYRNSMGFKNEKYLLEKQSRKFLFW
jgi:hypothetical protein